MRERAYAMVKGKAGHTVGKLQGTAPSVHEMHPIGPPVPELHTSQPRELAGSVSPEKMK